MPFYSVKPCERGTPGGLTSSLKHILFNNYNQHVYINMQKHTKKTEHDLKVFTNECLRQILNIDGQTGFWRKNQTTVVYTIKQRKWRWIGHILQRSQSNVNHEAGARFEPSGQKEKGTTCDDMEKDTGCGVYVNLDDIGRSQKSSTWQRQLEKL